MFAALPVASGELESLTRPPPTDQLERAKHMAVSLIQNALEGRAARAEDIGRQFLTYGYRCACVVCFVFCVCVYTLLLHGGFSTKTWQGGCSSRGRGWFKETEQRQAKTRSSALVEI